MVDENQTDQTSEEQNATQEEINADQIINERQKLQKRKMIMRIVTTIIMIPILIVIVRNVYHALVIHSQIATLDREAEMYRESIKADSTLLEGLKHNDRLEEYARENYYMQKKGEKIYIIED